MDIESSKTLGGVGAILMVIAALVTFGSFYAIALLIVGAILVLIALKGFADYYQHGGIFSNALYGFMTAIIGVIVAVVMLVILLLPVFAKLIAEIEFPIVDPEAMRQIIMKYLWDIIGPIIGTYIVLIVTMILSAVLIKKSLDVLAEKSVEKNFRTAGLLWLIGGVLTIILIGFIIIWIAWIIMAVGFFSIKTTPT